MLSARFGRNRPLQTFAGRHSHSTQCSTFYGTCVVRSLLTVGSNETVFNLSSRGCRCENQVFGTYFPEFEQELAEYLSA
jgi:hypothetical protein